MQSPEQQKQTGSRQQEQRKADHGKVPEPGEGDDDERTHRGEQQCHEAGARTDDRTRERQDVRENFQGLDVLPCPAARVILTFLL